jgi:ribosomal protein S2
MDSPSLRSLKKVGGIKTMNEVVVVVVVVDVGWRKKCPKLAEKLSNPEHIPKGYPMSAAVDAS